MRSISKIVIFFLFDLCVASYHEQYRVPLVSTDKLESYMFNDKEYIIQNLPVNWENAKIICQGHHNGLLAVLDTREKAEFMAEALSELQFSVDAVWVGARRESSEDPEGYRWNQGVELRRTAADVLDNEGDDYKGHYPMWLNRTRVPVPAGGADCVALERVQHDAPVFMDLPCAVRRAFVCERDVQKEVRIHQVNTVRCRANVYRVFDGRLDWHQAAAYCVLRNMALSCRGPEEHVDPDVSTMLVLVILASTSSSSRSPTITPLQPPKITSIVETSGSTSSSGPRHLSTENVNIMNCHRLANIGSMKCLKKLGLSMLKSRPSIESAWVGASGSLGVWSWIDNGVNIFTPPPFSIDTPWLSPPLRHRHNSIKQNGCLQIDRHESRTPVFIEARCERKMQFICYQGPTLQPASPSDDNYRYVLVRQSYYWQHALDNCAAMNGTLASVDGGDTLVQLLLVMGESGDEPVEHVWVSGRLKMSKDAMSDTTSFSWYNPTNSKTIPDPKSVDTNGLYMPPWLDDDFTMDSPCLNLDRQDHLNGLVYGLPCDTPQYSICMIDKSLSKHTNVQGSTEGYEITT